MNIKSLLVIGFASLSLMACQKEVNNVTPAIANNEVASETQGPTNAVLDYYNCGDVKTVVQRTANNIDVGTIKITNNNEFIEVTYSVSGNWILNKTKIYIGYESDIPTNWNGTPKTGSFPYRLSHPWDTDTYKLRIPRGNLTGNIVVIAQADVLKVNKVSCAIYDSQCSSGLGNPFPNATGCTPEKIYFDIQECTDY